MNAHSDAPLSEVCALVDKADALACQFIQPDKPFSKQGVYDHVRPNLTESAGISTSTVDAIVWEVIDGIFENALRSIQDSGQ